MEWMILPLKRYAQFTGRSRRKEFWLWILFQVIAGFVLGILDTVFGLGGHASGVANSAPGAYGAAANLRGGVLSNIFSLAVLIPSIAVSVRRMHDINRSGWWILLPLVPIVIVFAMVVAAATSTSITAMVLSGIAGLAFIGCAIVVFVWYCTAGTIGPNRFGDDPKADIPADLARTFE
uniref:DUF805 domain-containing protein n=1 Tax=uncultured Sphingomonas sp. TaxID=158754 RepID=UPI0035CB389C